MKCRHFATLVTLALVLTTTVVFLGHSRVGALSIPVNSLVAKAGSAKSSGCDKPKLLGILVPWYNYLDVEQDGVTGGCGIKSFQILPGKGADGKAHASDVPLVLIAVIDDLIRIAGLAAVAYVIFGGVQYATSQGNPEATAKAQSTVLNALIGLALAITAIAFVSFLGSRLS